MFIGPETRSKMQTRVPANYPTDTNLHRGKCVGNYPSRDRLCGIVVRAPGYRPRGPGSIPGDFLRSNGSGTGSTQPREYN
jgi:hypothetical protein